MIHAASELASVALRFGSVVGPVVNLGFCSPCCAASASRDRKCSRYVIGIYGRVAIDYRLIGRHCSCTRWNGRAAIWDDVREDVVNDEGGSGFLRANAIHHGQTCGSWEI